MRLLRTLARVAFICNICFLLTIAQRYIPNPPEGEIVSTILVLGYFLGAIVNILLNVTLLILLIFGRLRRAGIPTWLMIVNFLFFLGQIYFISISFHA